MFLDAHGHRILLVVRFRCWSCRQRGRQGEDLPGLANHFCHRCKELAKVGRQALEFKQKGESLAVDLQAGASPDKDGKCLIPAICDLRVEWSHLHHHSSLITAGNSGCPTGTEPTSGRAMALLLFVWLCARRHHICHILSPQKVSPASNVPTYPRGPIKFY